MRHWRWVSLDCEGWSTLLTLLAQLIETCPEPADLGLCIRPCGLLLAAEKIALNHRVEESQSPVLPTDVQPEHLMKTVHVGPRAMGSGAEKVEESERRIEPVVVRIRTRVCSVIEPILRGGERWGLEAEGRRLSATMLDWRFRERVERGDVVVDPGDVLVCRMQVVDRQTAEGPAVEHEIVEVRDHLVPGRRAHVPVLPPFT